MKKLIASAILILLLLSACQTASQSSSVGGEPTARMTNGTAAKWLLDPANGGEDSKAINGYIYETLVYLVDGQAVGLLADTGTVSADGLSYTFHLLQDVKFHDGTPFNADAVIANFNRWYDPQDPLRGTGDFSFWKAAFGSFRGEAGGIYDGIEKAGEYTVLVHLNQPDPGFVAKLADPAFGIVSPTALAKDGTKYGTRDGSAVGTGPYKVGAWTDQGLTLEPNPDYWGMVPTDVIEFK
jgi:peptide/nickel transport system substrate-binding protein